MVGTKLRICVDFVEGSCSKTAASCPDAHSSEEMLNARLQKRHWPEAPHVPESCPDLQFLDSQCTPPNAGALGSHAVAATWPPWGSVMPVPWSPLPPPWGFGFPGPCVPLGLPVPSPGTGIRGPPMPAKRHRSSSRARKKKNKKRTRTRSRSSSRAHPESAANTSASHASTTPELEAKRVVLISAAKARSARAQAAAKTLEICASKEASASPLVQKGLSVVDAVTEPPAPQSFQDKRDAAVAQAADVSRRIDQRMTDLLENEPDLRRLHQEGMKSDSRWEQLFREYCTSRGVMMYDQGLQDKDFLASFIKEAFKYQTFVDAPWAKRALDRQPALYTDDNTEAYRRLIRSLIQDLYRRCNPSKLGEVDSLMEKYKGAEAEIYAHACKKYGQAPQPVELASAKNGAIESAAQGGEDAVQAKGEQRGRAAVFQAIPGSQRSSETGFVEGSSHKASRNEECDAAGIKQTLASEILDSEAAAPDHARVPPGGSDNAAVRPGVEDRAEELRTWLLRLDGGAGGMLKYFDALEEEFDADLRQVKAVREVESGSNPNMLESIDPVFWETVGITKIGHRMLFAKAIAKL